MAVKSTPVQVRASTLLGMAVMDAVDAGGHGTAYLHDVPRATRDAMLARLAGAGWEINAYLDNEGQMNATAPGGLIGVGVWIPDSERCPECGGSGVSSVEPGERCVVCEGRG